MEKLRRLETILKGLRERLPAIFDHVAAILVAALVFLLFLLGLWRVVTAMLVEG